MISTHMKASATVPISHLVLLQTALMDHLIALLLERDDDQSHEDVDEEEREDHEVDHVEDGHLHPVPATRTHVLLCDIGGVLQDPEEEGHRSRQSRLKFLQTFPRFGGKHNDLLNNDVTH